MTTNQIAYWNLQESKRANRSQESIKGEELSEKMRANRATEAFNRDKLAVDQRMAANKNVADITSALIKGAVPTIGRLI